MPNCKFCGKPVRCVTVYHAACWETAADKVAEKFCDEYCRFPRECSNEDELHEQHCEGCVVAELLNVGV